MHSSRRGLSLEDIVRVSEKIADAFESEVRQLPPSCYPVSLIAEEEHHPSSLHLIKSACVEALHASLSTINNSDLTALPEESGVSFSVLADAIQEDANQVARIIPNLKDDAEFINSMIKNYEFRTENILEIANVAAEVEQDNSDFDKAIEEMESLSRSLDKALVRILSEGYPNVKNDIKTIIEQCHLAQDEDFFTKIPSDVCCEALNLLLVARIIIRHPEDGNRFRLFRVGA